MLTCREPQHVPAHAPFVHSSLYVMGTADPDAGLGEATEEGEEPEGPPGESATTPPLDEVEGVGTACQARRVSYKKSGVALPDGFARHAWITCCKYLTR